MEAAGSDSSSGGFVLAYMSICICECKYFYLCLAKSGKMQRKMEAGGSDSTSGGGGGRHSAWPAFVQ